MHEVFISYSSQDKTVANAVCAGLEARGTRCWIAPRDIVAGKDWAEAIIDGIHESRAMVLIFSAHANESQQIKRELERAVSKDIPVVPVRIEEIAPAKTLEYFMSNVHWFDAMPLPIERYLDQLNQTVR